MFYSYFGYLTNRSRFGSECLGNLCETLGLVSVVCICSSYKLEAGCSGTHSEYACVFNFTVHVMQSSDAKLSLVLLFSVLPTSEQPVLQNDHQSYDEMFESPL